VARQGGHAAQKVFVIVAAAVGSVSRQAIETVKIQLSLKGREFGLLEISVDETIESLARELVV
jgi:hypothetical protein